MTPTVVGWGLVALAIVWSIGRWWAAGVYFEPWALVAFAAGLPLIVYGRIRDRTDS